MSASALLLQQLLNGVQLGLMLFMMAAGLTLIFGMMRFLNLAHGTLFMGGAYLAAWLTPILGSVAGAIALATLVVGALGALLELVLIRSLYRQGHMDQLLATFGLIYIGNDLVRLCWGTTGLSMLLPRALNAPLKLAFVGSYSVFKLIFIGCALLLALALGLVLSRTRIGMQIRAGASDRDTTMALGINIGRLFLLVFAAGSAVAGFAGAMSAPLLSASIGMGDRILVLCLVVIVLGRVGSVKGAFVAALTVGLLDVLGRAYLTRFLSAIMGEDGAATVGPSLSALLVYLLMAVVLVTRRGQAAAA